MALPHTALVLLLLACTCAMLACNANAAISSSTKKSKGKGKGKKAGSASKGSTSSKQPPKPPKAGVPPPSKAITGKAAPPPTPGKAAPQPPGGGKAPPPPKAGKAGKAGPLAKGELNVSVAGTPPFPPSSPKELLPPMPAIRSINATGAPPPASAPSPKRTYTGTVFAITEGTSEYFLQTVSGMTIRLPGQPIDTDGRGVTTTTTVRMTCSNITEADTCPVMGPATVLPGAAATAQQTTNYSMQLIFAVVRGCGHPPHPYVELAFSTLGAVKTQIQRCSYGAVSVASYQLYYYDFPDCSQVSKICASPDTLSNAILRAWGPLQPGQHLMVWYPEADDETPQICAPNGAWLGLALLGGQITWYPDNAIGYRYVFMQELIHNLGLSHSSKDTSGDQLCDCERVCSDKDGGLCDPCADVKEKCHKEYGDASSCMGTGDTCPSAADLYRLGWSQAIAELDSSNMPAGVTKSYVLPPTQRNKTNVVVIRPTWTVPYTSNLYFSTRQPVGGDIEIGGGFAGTLSVHLSDRIVDAQPVSDNSHMHILGVYRPYQFHDFAEFGIRATVKSSADKNGNLPISLCRYVSNADKECGAGSTGVCADVDATSDCQRWKGEGYCSTSSDYYAYMNQNCSQTCRFCSDDGVDAPCEDNLGMQYKCEDWKSACQPDNKYYGWAKDNCPQACGFCSSSSTTTACEDNRDMQYDCADWTKECKPGAEWFSWAQDNCPKTCGLCAGGNGVIDTCRDVDQCAAKRREGACDSENPDHAAYQYMTKNCAKTCNFCTGSDPSEVCEDAALGACAQWRQSGYCARGSEYYTYMMDNCQKTCGACTSTS